MSISRFDSSGISGQSYDRNVFEANLSTVNKLQRDYWNAKQVLRKKLGKEEDKHIVASDSEIDSKLELFYSVQSTCSDLIKTLEKYQKCICVLSREENAMGRFLKEQGSLDKTAAGKMMAAVGKAQCYTSQQRLNLRQSLGRLLQDIDTFRYRAVGDSVLSIDQMEDARTHYRASLRWMQDISANLDPEQFKKLEKFRKVQHEVRLNKEKFDRQKWAVCQKVDLLCASRSNMFSNTLVPYQNDILKFWEKTAHTMAAVLENIRDFQNYEFKLLKGLNPLQINEKDDQANEKDENDKKDENKETVKENDDKLIDFDETQNSASNDVKPEDDKDINLLSDDRESLNNYYAADNEHVDVYHDIRMLDEIADELPLLDIDEKHGEVENGAELLIDVVEENADQQPSKEDLDLLNDILGNENSAGNNELEQQWQSVFGDFVQAPSSSDSQSISTPAQDTTSSQAPTSGGFLPSQLMDMMTVGGEGNYQFNQQTSNLSGIQQVAPFMPNMQPPTYHSMFNANQPVNNQPFAGAGTTLPNSEKKDPFKGNKSDWFNLFAELDPLQNPDSLGRKKDEEKKDVGSC